MAQTTKTKITDKHSRVLEFVYHYYEKNRVGPLFMNIKKSTGVSRPEIETLFPYGLNSVYTWVGIPIQNPTSSCKPPVFLDVEDYHEIYMDHIGTTYLRPEIQNILIKYYQG